MSANTSPDNITYPVSTDAISPLETVFATMATSVQTALTNRFAVKQSNTYKWANAAAKNAQTGMTEGDYGDQADANIIWRYDGTVWLALSGAQVPVIPTSVAGTGVTLGTGNKVSFSASPSISVNGCFTTNYDNYVIVFDIGTIATAANVNLRLRAAGTDLSSATYAYGGVANNTTATAVGSQATSYTGFYLSRDPTGALNASGEVTVFSPALAIAKRVISKSVTGNASYVTGDIVGGYQSSAVAYDGFTVINDAGSNMTGALRVYGYNNT